MELKFKGSFKHDLQKCNRTIVRAVYETTLNIAAARGLEQINNLKKLRKFNTHYRIKVANDYRIGLVIRKRTIWFVRIGHRSIFYKKFP